MNTNYTIKPSMVVTTKMKYATICHHVYMGPRVVSKWTKANVTSTKHASLGPRSEDA